MAWASSLEVSEETQSPLWLIEGGLAENRCRGLRDDAWVDVGFPRDTWGPRNCRWDFCVVAAHSGKL